MRAVRYSETPSSPKKLRSAGQHSLLRRSRGTGWWRGTARRQCEARFRAWGTRGAASAWAACHWSGEAKQDIHERLDGPSPDARRAKAPSPRGCPRNIVEWSGRTDHSGLGDGAAAVDPCFDEHDAALERLRRVHRNRGCEREWRLVGFRGHVFRQFAERCITEQGRWPKHAGDQNLRGDSLTRLWFGRPSGLRFSLLLRRNKLPATHGRDNEIGERSRCAELFRGGNPAVRADGNLEEHLSAANR